MSRWEIYLGLCDRLGDEHPEHRPVEGISKQTRDERQDVVCCLAGHDRVLAQRHQPPAGLGPKG